MAEFDTLRSRLIAFRADMLGRLAEADRIEPGYLALLAGAEAALRALDAEAATLPADAAALRRWPAT